MKRNLREAIKKLQAGEIDVPFESEGKRHGEELRELEKLRQRLLEERIRSEEEKSEIDARIAGIAHDLKTPLATVSGYAECIQDGIDDKDYPELIIEKTRAMTEQVADIVESVRSGKGESPKFRVRADICFPHFVKEIASGIVGCEIDLKIKNFHRGYIYIDRKKLYRVIQNIISNAAKYSKDGKVKITVRGRIWGDKYYLMIKDNGIGISKEDRKHVFDKFYMADKSRGKGGSGLGLYLCKEFLTEHGGEIKVKSDGKHGSEFVIALPLCTPTDKTPVTEKFESKNNFFKVIVFMLFGWFASSIYRFIRFHEKRCPSTLLAGMVSLLFIFPLWFLDVVSEIVYNKLTFLAD